jgi:hypothetical protein
LRVALLGDSREQLGAQAEPFEIRGDDNSPELGLGSDASNRFRQKLDVGETLTG